MSETRREPWAPPVKADVSVRTGIGNVLTLARLAEVVRELSMYAPPEAVVTFRATSAVATWQEERQKRGDAERDVIGAAAR